MKFRLRKVMTPFARALQRAYARAVRGGAPRVPHEGNRGPVGGSLAQEVQRPDLVRHERWGFVFSPSRIGKRFVLWWRGTKRQRPRGRVVSVDTDRLASELERELARQVEAEDRRSAR
ncbi:MAG: hypothetical protein KDD82_22345 [Planctomycetes bacterium]|nr:hypothetical protein [Planctomycetota bacterium]